MNRWIRVVNLRWCIKTNSQGIFQQGNVLWNKITFYFLWRKLAWCIVTLAVSQATSHSCILSPIVRQWETASFSTLGQYDSVWERSTVQQYNSDWVLFVHVVSTSPSYSHREYSTLSPPKMIPVSLWVYFWTADDNCYRKRVWHIFLSFGCEQYLHRLRFVGGGECVVQCFTNGHCGLAAFSHQQKTKWPPMQLYWAAWSRSDHLTCGKCMGVQSLVNLWPWRVTSGWSYCLLANNGLVMNRKYCVLIRTCQTKVTCQLWQVREYHTHILCYSPFDDV